MNNNPLLQRINKTAEYSKTLNNEYILLLPPAETLPKWDSILLSDDFIKSHIIKVVNQNFESLLATKIKFESGALTLATQRAQIQRLELLSNTA